MREIRTSRLMSGKGNQRPPVGPSLAPFLDSTFKFAVWRGVEAPQKVVEGCPTTRAQSRPTRFQSGCYWRFPPLPASDVIACRLAPPQRIEEVSRTMDNRGDRRSRSDSS